MPLETFLERHGESFVIARGEGESRAKGLRDTDKRGREYIAFPPGTDVRRGDFLRGEQTGNEHHVIKVESDLMHGEIFQVKAFCETDDGRPAAGHNTLNIGSMSNSAVQQGSPGAMQSVAISADAKVNIAEIVNGILSVLERLKPSEDEENEVRAEIDAIKSQLRLSAPKQNIIVECFKSIKNKLGSLAAQAGSSAAAAFAIESVDKIAAFLSHHGG